MNIKELNQYGDFALPLEMLYQKTGNCPMNGFLGERLKDVSFDEEGRLEFSTHKEVDGTTIDSRGAVLTDSVLVRQNRESEVSTFHYLYSWDVPEGAYTFLAFDDEDAMKRFYQVIKRFDANLCDADISSVFQKMGLTFDSVTQVLLRQKASGLDEMFQEESTHTDSPFTR